MTKDYCVETDGRCSYELAMEIIGEQFKRGECVKRGERCAVCGKNDCRVKKGVDS